MAFETTKDGTISELAWRVSNWNEPYAIMNLHGTNGTYHETNQLTNYIYIYAIYHEHPNAFNVFSQEIRWATVLGKLFYSQMCLLDGWKKFQRYNYPTGDLI